MCFCPCFLFPFLYWEKPKCSSVVEEVWYIKYKNNHIKRGNGVDPQKEKELKTIQ